MAVAIWQISPYSRGCMEWAVRKMVLELYAEVLLVVQFGDHF